MNSIVTIFLILLRILSLSGLIYSKESDDDFLWGVATAAYQIEGAVSEDGRGPSIWDTFSKIPNKISHNQNGDIADDSYHLVEEDIKLLKELGVNSYRFSISWSRILPKGYGKVNRMGIDHYNKVIDRLVEEGIQPLVTLYHWDLPQGIEDAFGGLLSEEFETHFVHYAEICFKEFGDRVKKWITINEPWTVSFMGYGAGAFAPGRCSDRAKCKHGNSATESYIAAHNMLNAHAAAVELYRAKYQSVQKGIIGITVNQDWAEPLTNTVDDLNAAERRRLFQLGWFTDPLYFGDYPPVMRELVGDRLPSFSESQKKRLIGSIDFLGLNHYSTKYYFHRNKEYLKRKSNPKGLVHGVNITEAENSMKFGGWADDQLNYETKYDVHDEIIGPQAQSSWLNVVPWGFYNLLMWVNERYESTPYHHLPIIITENGCDAPDDTRLAVPAALKDNFRINYFSKYLAEMERAKKNGVNIVGYFAWSLMDNFEWADGYDMRFGLYYVDYNDPKRRRLAKDSVFWYKQHIEKHSQAKSWTDILADSVRNSVELIASGFSYQLVDN